MSRSVLLALLASVGLALQASAQTQGDIDLLAQVYGTRPPQSYYALKARQPDAFQFRGAWFRRMPRAAAVGGGAAAPGAPAAVLGPRGSAVQGTFHFPLVIGLFADSPPTPPFSTEAIQTEFFDGPNSYYKTITEFYQELSGGKVLLKGHAHGWVRSTLTQNQVTADQSALPGRLGDYLLQVLTAVDDGTIDWGLYDNDGPDGVPNSLDDDGVVDILAVMHPTTGAECDGSTGRVWSHKWNLQSATGQTYRTKSASARGGFVRIDDYTIQPAYACGGGRINQIGVFAHELGHAFGLPDLYCTGAVCSHSAIGRWGLMGSGAWGCAPPPANRPDRPCHMGAWEKEALGWVDVETLPADRDMGTLTLGPVQTTRRVLRIDAADGSGDYFLLENRQKVGFDADAPADGMLVWRVDTGILQQRWPANTVNNDRSRMAVSIVQADGNNHLGTLRCATNCGDAGDPFPGAASKVVLHTGSTPSTRTHSGTASGLTILDIQAAGSNITLRALTRFQQILLRTTGGSGSPAFMTVDGRALTSSPATVRAAPFQVISVEAAAGIPVSEGVRFGFERWSDGPSTRTRTYETPLGDGELVAEYGTRVEHRLRVGIEGSQFGVTAGTISTQPASGDQWFREGTPVQVTASATQGFGFLRWGGPLAGQPNPTVVQMSAPVDASAMFELTYKIPGGLRHQIPAATPQQVVLGAENGKAPVVWSLVGGKLPSGMTLSPEGVIGGAAVESGQFDLQVRAVDASGLIATGSFVLEVGRPLVGVQSLVGMFLGDPVALTELQRVYLDNSGNRNGIYDLGDLRAFFLANPGLPMTPEQRAIVRTLVPAVTFGPGGGER